MRFDSDNPNNAPWFNFIVITFVHTARWTFIAGCHRFGVSTDLIARNSQDLQVRRVAAFPNRSSSELWLARWIRPASFSSSTKLMDIRSVVP
jgi:hypothetical protein